jgi:hypothetical protein
MQHAVTPACPASLALSHLGINSVPVKGLRGKTPRKPLSVGNFRRIRVGFESSQFARRRLAALASSNDRVQEALSASVGAGHWHLSTGQESRQQDFRHDREVPLTANAAGGAPRDGAPRDGAPRDGALVRHLDSLAQDIMATPGAGGALLAAYAAQARALSMVVEAAKRAGSAPLPASVLMAAQEALLSSAPVAGLVIG